MVCFRAPKQFSPLRPSIDLHYLTPYTTFLRVCMISQQSACSLFKACVITWKLPRIVRRREREHAGGYFNVLNICSENIRVFYELVHDDNDDNNNKFEYFRKIRRNINIRSTKIYRAVATGRNNRKIEMYRTFF